MKCDVIKFLKSLRGVSSRRRLGPTRKMFLGVLCAVGSGFSLMPCTRPIEGYRAPNGVVSFVKRYGWSDKPVKVPCGQCMSCRLEKSRQWAMRIMHEASLYSQNSFLTLTYSDENIPVGETLVKDHHRLFMMRLRKKFYPRRIRYYHCGEYGDETNRPHYHTIVFNLDFVDKRFHKTTDTGSKLYISAELDEIWGYGQCYVGAVTFESAAYCGRYVMKKLTGNRAAEYGSREPEYSTMSRKPGLGAPWLAKWKTDVFPLDACIVNGRKVRVPKYYDQLILASESRIGTWGSDSTGYPMFYPSVSFSPHERIKNRRVRKSVTHAEDQTRERLDVIEECTRLRVERLKRK